MSAWQIRVRLATESKVTWDEVTALARITQITFRYLAVGGLIPSVLIMLLAPTVVDWLLDESWQEVGFYLRWLMPWVYVTLLAIPLSFVMDIERRLGFQFRYQLGSFLLRAGALYLGAVYLQAQGTIVLYSGICALLGGYLVWEMLRMVRISIRKWKYIYT